MNMFSSKGLNARMLISIGTAVFLGLAATITIVLVQATRQVRSDAMRISEEQAALLSGRMEKSLNDSIDVARSVANAFEGMIASGRPLDRAVGDALLKHMLDEHPDLIGVWTVWEPNAFDGQDASHANQPGHDATGRYVPYWNRGSGKIELEPNKDYTVDGAGDYYLVTKRNNQETVLEPYLYKVGGKDVLMTSLVVPVHDTAGKFVGAAGVDLPLKTLAESIAKEVVGQGGYAALASNKAVYIAHPKAERCGQPVVKTDPWVEPFLDNFKQGKNYQTDNFSHTLNDTTFRFGSVVHVGESTTPWMTMVTVRESEVLAPVVRMRNTILAIGVAVLLAVLAIVWWLARSISRPIRVIASDLENGSEQVSAASEQVAAAGQSLAEGASEQASSLEETSSTLEEMTSMTRRTADSAESAKTLAGETRRAAEAGAADTREMTTAMADLQQTSKNVAKIIKTIDEIAFQTNILALNAAVEAARAGEAGAGFAVVAEEVRALAQRSASAARETAETIETTVRMSERGVAISSKVTQGLTDILDKASRVDELVTEIATASKEQSEGISQINVAVSQMDKVTQSSAAGAEESASASEELNGQAASLKAAVVDLMLLVDGQSSRKSNFSRVDAEATESTDGFADVPARSAPIHHHNGVLRSRSIPVGRSVMDSTANRS